MTFDAGKEQQVSAPAPQLSLILALQSNLSEVSPGWAEGLGNDNSRRNITKYRNQS
jgi:hypothetical protein